MSIEVPTPDGRTLEVLLAGPEYGYPLVFHYGTPQGAVPLGPLDRAAVERDLRTIAYSRPGYGTSTPRRDGATTATVADDARDTAVILDRLGIDDFITLGWSGGGPRALACAALLPGRCRAAACGVGIAPAAEYDGDIRDGMGVENVEEYTAALGGEQSLAEYLEPYGAELASVTSADIIASLGDLLPDVDKAALTGELAEELAASMRHGQRQGIVGWLHDDLTHLRPWGFDLGAITVPVAIWQGRLDRMVPSAHAEWLAAHVAGAQAHFVEGEGHLSLLSKVGAIIDDLRVLAGR
jgi:pimeloyl-ACP methyl ester carboxylesterase